MNGKKAKALRKLANGQKVPTGHLSAIGSNKEITNKTIARRLSRFYNHLDPELRTKFNKKSVEETLQKNSL